VAKANASEALARTMGDISSNIFFNNYANERQLQQGAPAMLGQGFELSMLPGQGLMATDQAQRQMSQMALDNARQKFMEVKQAPWYGLGEAAQILSQGGFSTVTGTQTGPNPNYVDPMTNFMKMALGGASTIAGLGGGGGFGWWGK
jgi:uncharacterized membrane protein